MNTTATVDAATRQRKITLAKNLFARFERPGSEGEAKACAVQLEKLIAKYNLRATELGFVFPKPCQAKPAAPKPQLCRHCTGPAQANGLCGFHQPRPAAPPRQARYPKYCDPAPIAAHLRDHYRTQLVNAAGARWKRLAKDLAAQINQTWLFWDVSLQDAVKTWVSVNPIKWTRYP